MGGFACEVLYRIEYDCSGGSLHGAVGLRFFRRMKRRSGSSPATASDGVIMFLLFQNAPGYSGGAFRLSSAPSDAADGNRISFPNGLLPGGNAGNAQFGTASLERCAAVAAADGPMAGNEAVFCKPRDKPRDNCARAAHRSQKRPQSKINRMAHKHRSIRNAELLTFPVQPTLVEPTGSSVVARALISRQLEGDMHHFGERSVSVSLRHSESCDNTKS